MRREKNLHRMGDYPFAVCIMDYVCMNCAIVFFIILHILIISQEAVSREGMFLLLSVLLSIE